MLFSNKNYLKTENRNTKMNNVTTIATVTNICVGESSIKAKSNFLIEKHKGLCTGLATAVFNN